MSGTMLADALDYAAHGWTIFPLDGKIPRTSRGHLDASADEAVIRRWWHCWPDANIGAPVPAGLIVVDVDPRNGGNLEALPLPETLTCISGRGDGGAHYYFGRPRGKLSSVGLPEGFDLKHNGYLVVPPSLHPDSGDPYSWVHRPVAACPANLRRAIVLPPARPGLPPRLPRVGLDGSHLVAFVARQPEGNVNNGLFWAACRAAEAGFDIGEALIAAAVYAGHPESGARRTVASAARKAHA